ncbi:MAG: GNAT family N-acetyltransferase [Raoultibacter sp.]
MNNASPSFRLADASDIPAILEKIRKLAVYEDAEDQVLATPELLHEWMFEKHAAETVVVEIPEKPEAGIVGIAVFFQNFSTWTGTAGMYLEDLFIDEEYRGGGTGRKLMAYLAALCSERGWLRLDWSCLDWNEPSLGFYKSIGAARMDEWVHHRLTGESLEALSKEAR